MSQATQQERQDMRLVWTEKTSPPLWTAMRWGKISNDTESCDKDSEREDFCGLDRL